MSGFFSKDEILLAARLSHVPGHAALYAIALGTAALTAFYMSRLYFRTFLGESRAPAQARAHVHEPASTVTYPLIVLALLSIFGGLVLGPATALDPFIWGFHVLSPDQGNAFARFLAPALSLTAHEVSASEERLLAARSVLVAGLGGLAAALLYVWRPALPARIRGALRPIHKLVEAKYYVDELYDRVFVRPLVATSERVLYRFLDAGLIDGVLVNGAAATLRGLTSGLLKYAQSGFAQSYLGWMALGTAGLLYFLVRQVA
jgi:NADH-quinone oxidoreductase subunit L